MIQLIRRWLMAREIDRRLNARKLLRPYRSAAAQKGWATRKAKA